MPEEPPRRLPGGAVPRHPASPPRPDGAPQLPQGPPPRPGPPPPHRRGGAPPNPRAPFDPRERPLGMIHETWSPVEEPGSPAEDAPGPDLGPAGAPRHSRHEHRAGPALTVWIIILLVAVVVILAVISYRRAPP